MRLRLLLCCCLLATTATAQDTYFAISLLGGTRPLTTQGGTIDLIYTEESLIRNQFFANTSIRAREDVFGLALGLEVGETNGWHLEGRFDASFGRPYRLAGELGLGWNLDNRSERFVFRPIAMFGIHSTEVDFGQLQNPFRFMRVDDKIFTNPLVNFRASELFLTARPTVAFIYRINDNFDIRAEACYQIILHRFIARLNFSAEEPDPNNPSETYTLRAADRLSEGNVQFIVDGVRQSSIPYAFQGFGFNVGMGFRFGGGE